MMPSDVEPFVTIAGNVAQADKGADPAENGLRPQRMLPSSLFANCSECGHSWGSAPSQTVGMTPRGQTAS